PDQITGRRVAIPMPTDCSANESDCQDVTVLNRLDGFNMNPQISIPFDGDIDPLTATSENVYIIALGDLLEPRGSERTDGAPGGDDDDGLATSAGVRTGRVIGINQIVWDVESHTLRASTDERLAEHSPYALVVTNGVHAADGRPIEASEEFGRYRHTLAVSTDPEARWYRPALLTAEWAARRSGADRHDTAAMSE